jgi:DNA-binding Lrp family transcriptional regulator
MKNKVLEILRNNARVSIEEIARRLDITPEDAAAQIDELERGRTVLGYQAVINPEKLDDEPVPGIIEVRVTPQRDVGYDEIASQIYRFPEVRQCYLISGAYDLLVFVEGKSLKEVATFVHQKLATIEHVISTTTHFILRKYKEAGVAISEPENTDRLPVAP